MTTLYGIPKRYLLLGKNADGFVRRLVICRCYFPWTLGTEICTFVRFVAIDVVLCLVGNFGYDRPPVRW